MKFNEKLKDLRIKNNMTQDDLANKLNISRQSISKWEQGINEPNIETLKKLCIIFNVSIQELIDHDESTVISEKDKKEKRDKSLFKIITALTLFNILTSFPIVLIMKDKIPMHYDFSFNITRYGSRWESIVIPFLSLIFYLIIYYFHWNNMRSKLVKSSNTAFIYISIMFLLIIIFGGYLWMGIHNASNLANSFLQLMTGMMFAMFLVLSVFSLPIFNPEPNFLFGFRTFLTLSNKEIWYKVNLTQSISGFIFSIVGYLITLITFKSWNVFLIGLIIFSIIPSMIHHEILRFRLKKER